MKANKFHPVHQIENLLKYWEDYHFLTGMSAMYNGLDDETSQLRRRLFRSWPDFRRFILDYKGGPFYDDYFVLTKEPGGGLVDIAVALVAWNHFSRRVYSISKELQHLLSTTSVDRIAWDDVRFPFESFLVTLDVPIFSRKGVAHDSLLFYRVQREWGEPEVCIMPLPTRLGEYGLNAFEKSRLLAAHCKKNFARIADLIAAVGTEVKFPHLPYVCEKIGAGRMVSDTIEKPFGREDVESFFDGENWPEWQMAIRIVVGLCMYFQHLTPEQAAANDEWRPVPNCRKLAQRRAISNEANICSVASIYRVSEEELARTRKVRGLYEVSAHWRAAHSRRPPGMGNDPNAEKTVRVKSVLVRKDLLKEGELPGGSVQIR